MAEFRGCVGAIFILLGIAHDCFAETLRINDFRGSNGNVVDAINSALKAAQPGDVVLIGKGVWDIDGKAIHAKSGVTIKGAGITETVLKHTSKTLEHPFLLIEGRSDVTISDLTLDGDRNPLCTHGIDGANINRIVVRNVRFQNLVQSSEFGTFGVDRKSVV